MPLKEIRRYAALRAEGTPTLAARMELLAAHRSALSLQIEQLQEHMKKLDDKIDFYRREIERTAT